MQEVHFCLHGIGAPPSTVSDHERPYWVTSERFKRILGLADRYETADRKILFSFDDGYKSDVVETLPILLEFGRKAAFFISSDMIGQAEFLDPADIVRISDAGMTIGSHGAAHVRWTGLGGSELAEQIGRSIGILSGIVRRPITSAAPPFGAYNRRVLQALRKLGISKIYTGDDAPVRSGAAIKARFSITMNTPLEAIELRLSNKSSHLRRIRAFARIRRNHLL